MTNLSPQVQAVLNAAYALPLKNGQPNIAAALRAAAAHLPSSAMHPSCDWGHGWRAGINDARQALLTIAAELEAHQ